MRINIKPSDIDISFGLVGSALGNSEKETVAHNIIFILKTRGDTWAPFSWDRYMDVCTHDATIHEKHILDDFCEDGLLTNLHECYHVQDAFIAKLWQFVRAPQPKGTKG